jgi:hypothetical protein
MQDYTDRLAARKLKNNSASIWQTANKDDLFRAALNHVDRPLARTLADLLYWSQFAKHQFRGRLGIYKEDTELGHVLGVHPKTAGRHVRELCAGGQENEAETAPGGAPKFFDVAYGPKPRARSGRSRWLFIRPEGLKVIAEALELERQRRERIAPADRKKKLRPRGSSQSDRSPQNAPTHIHTYTPGEQSGALSSSGSEKAPGETNSKKESQVEVNRLKESWNKVCEQSGRHDLVWRDQDVDRYAKELAETVTVLQLHKISDADLDARLTVLCTDLDSISDDMSEAFAEYNRHGLEFSSFVKYAPKLMKLGAERASSKSKSSGPVGKFANACTAATAKPTGPTPGGSFEKIAALDAPGEKTVRVSKVGNATFEASLENASQEEIDEIIAYEASLKGKKV